MDLTPQLEALSPARVNLVLESLLSSDLRLKILLVSANRLGLMVSALRLKARRVLIGAMTCQEDALPYLKAGLPGMLICSDRLDGGDGYALARQARLLVPDIRIMMLLEEANPDVAQAVLSNVDAIIVEADIGDRLGISLTTVKDHTKVLRSKFGVKSKVQLVMRAMRLAISR